MLYPDLGAPVSEKLAGFTHISIWGPDLILRSESGHLELLTKSKFQQEIDGIGGILGKDTTTYPSILVMLSGGFQWVSFSSASYLVGWSPEMEFLNTFCTEIGQWKERTDALISTLDSKNRCEKYEPPSEHQGDSIRDSAARHQYNFSRRDIDETNR